MIDFVEIDGKEVPKWNGEIMTPEKTVELIGVEKEFPVFGKLVVADLEYYYTDLDLFQLLSYFGKLVVQGGKGLEVKPVGETNNMDMDELLDASLLVGNSFMVGMRVKPFSEFEKKYPNFNREAYMDYFDELNGEITKRINKIVNS